MSLSSAIVPDYPIQALPECSRPLVLELAEIWGCSPSLPATLAIGVMSGAAGQMAHLGRTSPRLWAVVKVPDSMAYTACMRVLLDPLRALADEVFEKEDVLVIDCWDDYDFLINRSLDASVLVRIEGRPKLCPQGLDTMSCIGRMAGELWLQPSLWQRLLCADCHGDLCGPAFPRSANEAARNAWTDALRAVLQRRVQLAGRPHKFEWSENLKSLFADDVDTDAAVALALLSALFSGATDLRATITDAQASAARELSLWHRAAKQRLWENAIQRPWGGAFFGESGSSSLPARTYEIAARLERREEQRAAQSGVLAGCENGSYLFVQDPTGIPCGLQQFRQVKGPTLTPAGVRRAINALEFLAAAANRAEMHWDHGIWGRNCPHALAAAVHGGSWAAIVVWETEPVVTPGVAEPRVGIKNLWVAKSARRYGLATSLVASVAVHTDRPPVFHGPFTDDGWKFADAWYRTRGGAPQGWQVRVLAS
jgi:hypothetical protein